MRCVTFGVIEEIHCINGDMRRSYGIAAYADTALDGTATIVASVHDVACDRQRLAAFVSQCNLLGLSLMHLNDVVEDFLVG